MISFLKISDALTFAFRPDGMGLLFLALSAAMFVLSAVFARDYLKKDAHKKRFFAFFWLTLLAIAGLCLAGNLLTFYLFYECMTLLSFPLVLHEGTEKARRAAFTYLGFSVFGAGLALGGLMLVGADAFQTFTAGGVPLPNSPRTTAAYLLIALGFSCKAGLLPMSAWLPTAHPEAPAPASAVLSGVITKAGVLGVIRATFYVFGAARVEGTYAQTVLLVLALATVFAGSMLAYREKLLKKRLAYSSVSQLSYVLTGIALLNPAAMLGALLQVVFHMFAKTGLFLTAGAVIHETGHTRTDELLGVGRRMPVTMTCFTLLSLSLIGIPPLGGFAAKWELAAGALAFGGTAGTLAVVTLLASALLTAGYLLPVTADAFFPGERVGMARREAGANMTAPLVLLSALALLLGAFPGGLTEFLTRLIAPLFLR